MKQRLAAMACCGLLALPVSALGRPAAPTVPPQFRGEWDLNPQTCVSRGGDAHLSITASRVGFYESEGPVRAVRRLGPRTVQLTIDLRGEGVTERQREVFEVSADGRRLTQRMDPPFTRVRCGR